MLPNQTRRDYLGSIAAAGAIASLAGCTGGDDDTDDEEGTPVDGNTVVAGPGGNFSFDPSELTIGAGETVTWEFDSPGHNVSARPEHSDEVELPDGAEPFSSYEGDDEFETMPEGETFEHTFEVAGTYRYVCIPHEAQGMIGKIVVEE